LLNIKINQRKLVSLCGYKLATTWQNITEIHLAKVKISQKVLGGGLLFYLRCRLSYSLSTDGLLRVNLYPLWPPLHVTKHNFSMYAGFISVGCCSTKTWIINY